MTAVAGLSQIQQTQTHVLPYTHQPDGEGGVDLGCTSSYLLFPKPPFPFSLLGYRPGKWMVYVQGALEAIRQLKEFYIIQPAGCPIAPPLDAVAALPVQLHQYPWWGIGLGIKH